MSERPWNEGGTEKPYSVTLWESHPEKENDDCSSGADFATLEEARACVSDLDAHFNPVYFSSTPFVMLDGPDVYEVTVRKDALRRQRRELREHEAECRRERAMQAGMMGGCDAYNNEMGW